jgi:hypothetical protein
MKIRHIRNIAIYIFSVGISICLLIFIIACSWIGNEVKSQCVKARLEYGGDCVDSLGRLLSDETKGYKARNEAIWALGQLGDSRALPALTSHYTGVIPSREPLDQAISQYELDKALKLANGGTNIIAWTWRGRISPIDRSPAREIKTGTLVMAENSDPYYSLAQKIAKEDGLDIVNGVNEALQRSPRFIILVSSPENLTAERLSDIGNLFQKQDFYPGLGIISGSTIDKAERLWSNRNQTESGNKFLGGDVDILQKVDAPTIFNISPNSQESVALTKETLIASLKQADFYYWARHTGPKDWSWNEGSSDWNENDQLLTVDIPELKPAVIYSLTCSSFRPWVENSIAIGFVDNGAAAFMGFMNTPHATPTMREALSVPGITSWKDFPIGLMAQIHNKEAAKSVFRLPQLFMLGDPRIYLSKEVPYQITSDSSIKAGKRIIKGTSDRNGILAVKIDGGARYHYLSVKGLSAISETDVFYNNKLQMMPLGEDMYVLLMHHGGNFEVELLPEAPFGWKITDVVLDAFDFSWVVLWLSTYADSNPQIHLISILIFICIVLFKTVKQKIPLKEYRGIFIAALVFTLAHLGYFLLRVNTYSVSANMVVYSPLQIATGCLGIFSGIAGGLMVMRDGKKPAVKLAGLLFAVLREFWMAAFYLVFITLLNCVTPITRNTGPWLLSYDNFWLAFIVLTVEIFVILVVDRYVITARGSRTANAS